MAKQTKKEAAEQQKSEAELTSSLKDQALNEIKFSYDYKKARMASWNKNEDMYYGRKVSTQNTLPYGGTAPATVTDTRADVSLGKMQGFVHTLLSKIDSPLTFKYIKGETADEKRAILMNALREKDAKIGRWNYKDLLGKKQAVIYGRAVYLYYATSENGYSSNLEMIDVKDFLIDPDVGGIDVENADYMGWYNTKLSKAQLLKGAESGLYDAAVVREIIASAGNNNQQTQQEIDKKNRFKAFAADRPRTMKRDDQWKFWTWITTWEDGERYYLVMTDSGQVIRREKWTDIKKTGKYPIWTWAAFPDATEFWSPSYCDYVREVFMAQEKSIDQMLDNSEQVNRPQKAVNVDYIRNLAQVKYKKDSYIEIDGNVDVNKVIQMMSTPPIDGPMKVYDKLEQIGNTESGVTADVKGTSDEDKVGIYEGNLQQAGDRFNLLNKSYAEGYYRFAMLYREGVSEHLKKKTAVEILGAMGLEIEMVTFKDLKPRKVDYDILVESSSTEAQTNFVDKKNKITFLQSYKDSQNINQKVLFEMTAKIAGFDDDEIKRLLDTSDYGDVQMISQAEENFQRLIQGQEVPLYSYADTAFTRRLVDLDEKYENQLSNEQHQSVLDYIEAMKPVVERNMARKLAANVAKLGGMDTLKAPLGTEGGLPAGQGPAEQTVPGAEDPAVTMQAPQAQPVPGNNLQI